MFQTCEFRSQKWQFPQRRSLAQPCFQNFTPFHGKKTFLPMKNCYMSLIPNPPYTWPVEPIISHHWLIWGFLKWSIPSPHPWVSIRSHGPMTRMIRVAPSQDCEMIRSTFSQSQFHATSWSMFSAVFPTVCPEVWTWISIRYNIYTQTHISRWSSQRNPGKIAGRNSSICWRIIIFIHFPCRKCPALFQIRAGAFKIYWNPIKTPENPKQFGYISAP